MIVDVVRTHLEMRALTELRPASTPAHASLARQARIAADEYRAWYALVGERWHWRDRLRMRPAELDAHLASPDVHVWTMDVDGERAGYFELQRHPDNRVEIMYFGLAASFFGRGLGGWMLTRAVEEAFALGPSLVTLHTCTLDSKAALPNYLARGFKIVRDETYQEEIG